MGKRPGQIGIKVAMSKRVTRATQVLRGITLAATGRMMMMMTRVTTRRGRRMERLMRKNYIGVERKRSRNAKKRRRRESGRSWPILRRG